MTNLTYFKALIKGREKIRSVGVYHFFLLHNSMKPSASWHFRNMQIFCGLQNYQEQVLSKN